MQAAWWNHNGLIGSGERTLVAGFAWKPVLGNVIFGGAEYFSVGSGAGVDATLDGTPLSLETAGEALYGGYRGRLGIFVLEVEGRVEVPTLDRHGLGFMAGIEL